MEREGKTFPASGVIAGNNVYSLNLKAFDYLLISSQVCLRNR